VTVKLAVRTAIWRSHVARVAADVHGLVPVIKGNGYGFGRAWLAGVAAEFSDTIAVGTVHELTGLPSGPDVVVLTPCLSSPPTTEPILTVAGPDHIAALDRWHGRVIVKLASAMQRYGGEAGLIDLARRSSLDVVGVSIHPPLAGEPAEHLAEISRALDQVEQGLPAWLSHLDVDLYAQLPTGRPYRLRLGTRLWHGDKSALHLMADVIDRRPIGAGEPAGYQLRSVPSDGHLVMIGAGTANGVGPLADGRSPFHFERQRLALHEPPHMHTTMLFVPDGGALPEIGAWVDVQRPLHMTNVDEYEWR
jgi:alanine racemase